MTDGLYRFLLRLLPRARRDQFGEEMTDVFAEQRAHTGGAAAGVLWMKEAAGIARFSWREWRARRSSAAAGPKGAPTPRGQFSSELRWAWRGVRARGWRAAFIVLLLGVAMAANTVVFSAADAFVFSTAPYGDPSTLVVLQRTSGIVGLSDYISPDPLQAWRQHPELFNAVHGHERGSSIFLTTNGTTDAARAQAVTPGLIEMLGAQPKWGRSLTDDDARPGAPRVVLIREGLARRLFGSPSGALNATIGTAASAAMVVGVMPESFRFPTAREEIWSPLDLSSWPKNKGLRSIARLAPGHDIEAARRRASELAPTVLAGSLRDDREFVGLRSLADARQDAKTSVVFRMLAGAAACLMLIACANVASLELASAARRARTFAVQSALGVPRRALVRGALLEGALLLSASVLVSAGLTWWGTSLLSRNLTATMRDALTNAIDLDGRAMLFMTLAAAAAWLLSALPAIRGAWRVDLVEALRQDARVMPVTRSSVRVRQFLMAGQVALTVLLLVGALLYIRSYAARLGIDKGFDVDGLATIQLSPATDAPLRGKDLDAKALSTIHGFPGVTEVTRTYSLPPSTEGGIGGYLHILGLDTPGRVMLSSYSVETNYFSVMGIPITKGRAFTDTSPAGEIVIDDSMAARFWPNGDALGARLRIGGKTMDWTKAGGGAGFGGATEFDVVGIANRMRADRTQTPAGEDVFVVYGRLSPESAPLTFITKLQNTDRLPILAQAVRAAAPRSIVRTETLAARYALLDADTRLAATITTGFGALALFIAAAGVYAVMAFLVAGRSREIGIRVALGADNGTVRRLILGSSLRFVLIGVGLGLLTAAGASRWIGAQLFGVSPTDPVTYALVSTLVIAMAMAATWLPARTASRMDPALTLRND